MTERLSDKVRDYLLTCQGKVVSLKDIREFLRIEPGGRDDGNLRFLMTNTLIKEKLVSASGRNDGYYKVVRQVKPVKVFGREKRPPISFSFPYDRDKGMEMDFAEHIVMREGDLILIAGQSNFGKTTMAMNFCAENIDTHPVLMGNEYTTVDNEPDSRFLDRLERMDWVEWYNGNGEDKFELLPVREDYAEQIYKDRNTIIDWINLDEAYNISNLMENIKFAIGRGIGVLVIQKSASSEMGRGGQYTKDFTQVEILLDPFGDNEVLLTLGKVKECTKPLSGKKYAFGIEKGVKIHSFRELKKCPSCYGKKFIQGKLCEECYGKGLVDA